MYPPSLVNSSPSEAASAMNVPIRLVLQTWLSLICACGRGVTASVSKLTTDTLIFRSFLTPTEIFAGNVGRTASEPGLTGCTVIEPGGVGLILKSRQDMLSKNLWVDKASKIVHGDVCTYQVISVSVWDVSPANHFHVAYSQI